MLVRYTLLWLFLPVIGTLNGTLRELVYKKYLAELPAHQLSTLSGILFIGCFTWWVTRKWPLSSSRQALEVGFVWVFLTVLFEFGFGHYVFSQPWPALLHDYNIAAGRIWTLVLLWVTLAPWIFYKVNLKHHPRHQPSIQNK